MIDLEAIKARARAATVGPWLTHEMPRNGTVFVGPGKPGSLSQIVYATAENMDDLTPEAAHRERSNAEFIAHARDDLPVLIAEVERLRAAVDRVKALDPSRVYGGGTNSTRIWLTIYDVHHALDDSGSANPSPTNTGRDE